MYPPGSHTRASPFERSNSPLHHRRNLLSVENQAREPAGTELVILTNHKGELNPAHYALPKYPCPSPLARKVPGEHATAVLLTEVTAVFTTQRVYSRL
jgi:hypothetical protein